MIVIKKIMSLLILLTIIHTSNSIAQDHKGKVRSYTEKKYKAVERDGHIENGEQLDWSNERHQYDNAGNETEWISYDSEDNIRSITKYTRNKDGNKVETKTYDADGSLKEKWVYEYDEKGNETEIERYNPDGSLKDKWVYEYDEKGNETEIKRYNPEGRLTEKTVYEYNERGKTFKVLYYEYDEADQSNLEFLYGLGNDGLVKWDAYLWDETEKHVIAVKRHNPVGKLESMWTRKYDKKGNCIEFCFYNSDETLYSRETYKYDKKGNLVEEDEKYNEKFKTHKRTYRYEYDRKGNWTKKIELKDGVPKFVWERKYEYY